MRHKRICILFVSYFSLLTAIASPRNVTIFLDDFLKKDTTSNYDAMPAIMEALDECRKIKATTLVLPEGIIKIKPDKAYEKYMFISNNDPSMKKIAFDLKDIKNFTIKGNNTVLLFSGFISPFNFDNCKNISIEGISIDYEHPFLQEGKICAAGDGWYELNFDSESGAYIQDGSLKFKDKNGVVYPYSSLLEFDINKKEVAYHAHDYWIWGESYPAVKTSDNNYRLFRRDFGEAIIGNILVLGASARINPAITIWKCENVRICDVNLYHCGGMGVIAQCSSNIELNKLNVIPSKLFNKRIISISADATHFINCKGYIKMINCDFRNQKDDATNIHGWYMSVDKKISNNKLLLRWKNSGQYGIKFIVKGMKMELVNNKTMNTYAHATVKDVKYINSQYVEVTFTSSLPNGIEKNHVIAEDENYPDVLIKDCYIGNNRARGLLLGSRGKIIVEGCTFHTAGSAILFEGDGNYWYEQSGVRNVIIKNNKFINCMYGSKTWGNACIAVGSGIPQRENSIYHKNIVVENNIFEGFDNRIINLYCVDNFIFRNNTIKNTTDYLKYGDKDKMFVYKNCNNIVIEK